jgi:hypothetical protein
MGYLSVETGIPISVLVEEPEDYINAMLTYLGSNRRSPFNQTSKLNDNAKALSELDALL